MSHGRVVDDDPEDILEAFCEVILELAIASDVPVGAVILLGAHEGVMRSRIPDRILAPILHALASDAEVRDGDPDPGGD